MIRNSDDIDQKELLKNAISLHEMIDEDNPKKRT